MTIPIVLSNTNLFNLQIKLSINVPLFLVKRVGDAILDRDCMMSN